MLHVQEIELAQLHPWLDNPRLNEHAVDAVAASIQSFGFNVPILCDQNLTIVAGHTRWKAAQKLAMTSVPVIVVEMTDAQRRAFSVADNKTAEIADWDFPKLRQVLEELRSEDIDLGCLGFSVEEMRRLVLDDVVNEDSIPEIDDSGAVTKFGDLYALGQHRLMCGDSRDSHSVARLTEGRPIDHVFGGPPCFNQRAFAHWEDYTSYLEDMAKIIENCHDLLIAGGVCVWNVGNGSATHHNHVSHHSMLFEEHGFRYLDTIVWEKTGVNFDIPRSSHIKRNGYYFPAFCWEALLVYQKPGQLPKMTAGGREYMSKHDTDVWQIPAVHRQLELYGHPAVCPVEIPYRSLQAYTGSRGAVFEPFGGSGTTLIAAEKAHRQAYLMEWHPAYCDMIVRRWEALTGERAVQIKT